MVSATSLFLQEFLNEFSVISSSHPINRVLDLKVSIDRRFCGGEIFRLLISATWTGFSSWLGLKVVFCLSRTGERCGKLAARGRSGLWADLCRMPFWRREYLTTSTVLISFTAYGNRLSSSVSMLYLLVFCRLCRSLWLSEPLLRFVEVFKCSLVQIHRTRQHLPFWLRMSSKVLGIEGNVSLLQF